MRFRIKEEYPKLISIIQGSEKPLFYDFEVNKSNEFECTIKDVMPALKDGMMQFVDFIEGTPFEYVRFGQTFTVNPLVNAGIQDLLDGVKVIRDEILTYSLEAIRVVSKTLGYIPATQQGAKQIVKKFEGREQEFLDLLQELYLKN